MNGEHLARSKQPKLLPGFFRAYPRDLNAPGLEPKLSFALINARDFTLDSANIDLAIRSLREPTFPGAPA